MLPYHLIFVQALSYTYGVLKPGMLAFLLTWILEITFVWEVGMHVLVCVCVPAHRLLKPFTSTTAYT